MGAGADDRSLFFFKNHKTAVMLCRFRCRLRAQCLSDRPYRIIERMRKMLKEYALKAWEMEKEKRKQSDFKKRKRKAKKIEEEIYDLLPKDSEDYDFQRHLDDSQYGVIVSLTEEGKTLNFLFDE